MLKFSANLGFLWTDLALPDAVRAAAAAGFDAVECHFPFAIAPADVTAALTATNMPMLGLNTRRGDRADDFGLAALVGREAAARAAIDEAVGYAAAIKARAVHVMAGRSGGGKAAARCFRANLAYAAAAAAAHGITILIEPINRRDVPDYHLSTTEDAVDIIAAVGAENIKMMFDCYHIQIMQGDVTHRIQTYLPYIGHVQIAAVPDRGEPDDGELDYHYVLTALDAAGYDGFVGAEYRPRTTTAAGLGWLSAARSWAS
jgi:hydroxypyruvate isomerase